MTLKMWDAASGAERATPLPLVGHTEPVADCAIGPDGTWIVSASHDGTLKDLARRQRPRVEDPRGSQSLGERLRGQPGRLLDVSAKR